MKEFKFDIQLFAEDQPNDSGAQPTDGAAPPAIPPVLDNQTVLSNTGDNPNNPNQEPPNPAANPESNPTPEVQYDFSASLPEGMQFDEKLLGDYTDMVRDAGLDNETANKFAQFGIQLQQEAANAIVDAFKTEVLSWGEQAKEQLGTSYEKTLQEAAVGVEILEKEIPELRQVLNMTGVGNHVAMMKVMAIVGRVAGEETGLKLLGGQSARSGGGSIYNKTNFDNY